jgi:hypothetical protein
MNHLGRNIGEGVAHDATLLYITVEAFAKLAIFEAAKCKAKG